MSTTPELPAEILAELKRAMPGIPDRDLPRFAASIAAPEPYSPGPDSMQQEDVPAGHLMHHRLEASTVYPGVTRDYWIYVPAACRADKPARLMVFQDGARYLAAEANVPVVFDNLIAQGAMPPTVGLFVQPGEPGPGLPVYGGTGNRSVEYDTVDGTYARLLVEELIPLVAEIQPLVDDPAGRAICGLSSGGICAFTAAWHRPDVFGKVVSHCGSFVDIRGGHVIPELVRRSEAKPLRVFLQTGQHDLNILFGDWVQANLTLASALAYRGYDHRLAVGDGGHSLVHGGAILPDTLRWLWRDAMIGA